MRFNNYEISHKNGYFQTNEYTISEKGVEYLANTQTYPNTKVCCEALEHNGEVFEDVKEVCNQVYKEYQQKESQRFIKEKTRLKADKEKRNLK